MISLCNSCQNLSVLLKINQAIIKNVNKKKKHFEELDCMFTYEWAVGLSASSLLSCPPGDALTQPVGGLQSWRWREDCGKQHRMTLAVWWAGHWGGRHSAAHGETCAWLLTWEKRLLPNKLHNIASSHFAVVEYSSAAQWKQLEAPALLSNIQKSHVITCSSWLQLLLLYRDMKQCFNGNT